MTNYELLYYILSKSGRLTEVPVNRFNEKYKLDNWKYVDNDAKEFLVHEFTDFIIEKLMEDK